MWTEKDQALELLEIQICSSNTNTNTNTNTDTNTDTKSLNGR